MNARSIQWAASRLLMIYAAGLVLTPWLRAADNEVVAVSSTASADYIRPKLADGSFAPETYVYAKGGSVKDSGVDASIDKISFVDVAEKLAAPLAHQNYISSKDPRRTKLMIMVYWGKTTAPILPKYSPEVQMAQSAADAAEMSVLGNEERSRLNRQNASLLGYDQWWNNTLDQETGPLSYHRRDLLSEIEDQRYFVVLMAYDFQLLWKNKKHKLLWETRFSIADRGHEFDLDLVGMAENAAKFFGQNTKGLVHKEIPEGHIETGELQVIDHPASK